MKKFEKLSLGVFFGVPNKKNVYVKITEKMAKDVVNCDYIEFTGNEWVIVYF